MDVVSLVISGLGLIVSVYAIRNANDAQTAVKNALALVKLRSDENHYREVLESLLETTKSARDAALRREKNAPAERSRGVREGPDLISLLNVENELNTDMPVIKDTALKTKISQAGKDISKARAANADESNDRDGWKDALAAFQVIIPSREEALRQLQKDGLTLTKQ